MWYMYCSATFSPLPLPLSPLTAADIKSSDDELTPLHFSSRYIPRYQKDSSEQNGEANESVAEVTISKHQILSFKINKLL